MALSAKALETLIYEGLTKTPLTLKGVVGAEVKQVPGPGGTMTSTAETTLGPVYMDKDLARVIAESIAFAVIQHILASAADSAGGRIT